MITAGSLSVVSNQKNVCVIVYSIFLFSNFADAGGFDSLLQQLPELGVFRKIFDSRIELNVMDYGAKGNGIEDDTKVFADVWDMACSSKVESRIIIPDGSYCLVKPISLGGHCHSKVTLVAITFHRCNNLVVKNLMIVNGQQMQMAFTTCDTVAVSHVSVFSPASSPNTDGIHISESTNVEIKDTTVRTGDDCISIVSNSSKVQVRRIVCGPGHGISIGSLGKSDTCDQVYDVSVQGAFLSNTENGLRIKTWQGGSGFVRNVTFEDVWMQNVSHPIIIDQYYCDSDKPCPNKTSAVNVENISFVNIGGTSATMEAIVFACSDVSPCEGVYLEDVEIVSAFGGVTTSFCWQVNGSTAGYVYPPICYSTCKSFIKQTISSATNLQAI
ncbi:probable polygalacturonase At1g80170 isoform X3 [Helianthus annuus]|uniref:probable polygalacturonase At1g80170 isoform X3 n=1 Tax=Helianthus annuus TaxID=4232 RepID=UPI000B8F8F14|nr:probable polygalacturonase At1g80170 isoform X3 [Helianthus annuus]